MTFYLWDTPTAELRLKSYSSISRGEKMTIKIEIETSDPYEFGHALQRLAEIQKGQRAKPEPKAKAKPLALPPPQRALPKPGKVMP